MPCDLCDLFHFAAWLGVLVWAALCVRHWAGRSGAGRPGGVPESLGPEPARPPATAAEMLDDFREGAFFEVVLSHVYETGLGAAGFSGGRLAEGSVLVRTLGEARAVTQRFRETGDIVVFECRHRYVGETLAPKLVTIRFQAADPKKNHCGLRYTRRGNEFVSDWDRTLLYKYRYSVRIVLHTNCSGVLD